MLHHSIRATLFFSNHFLQTSQNHSSVVHSEGIRNEEQDYYKQVRVDNYWNNSYTQYENNHGRNKNPIIQRIPR